MAEEALIGTCRVEKIWYSILLTTEAGNCIGCLSWRTSSGVDGFQESDCGLRIVTAKLLGFLGG